MTRVKICGIQQPDHAIAAAEAGADFIGLVFVPNRRRRLTVGAANTVVSSLKISGQKVPLVVGLFADQPLEEVNHIIHACHLDVAQLCGRESADYCKQVQAQVIKVLHVSNPPRPPLLKGGEGAVPLSAIKLEQGEVPPFDEEPALSVPKGALGGISPSTEQHPMSNLDIDRLAGQIRACQQAGHLITLDRQVDGLQGGTGQSFDWEIAAQLSREGHSFLLAGGLTPHNVAQAVATVQPWGVDVSSGVEAGGVKDPDKIRAFIKNAKYPVP